MKRKFKLIKDWPGNLIPLDTVVTEWTDGISVQYNYNSTYIPESNILNYPEFWQEVTEPCFITEDNVKKFIGDKFYVLRICKNGFEITTNIVCKNVEYNYNHLEFNKILNNNDRYCFDSKKNAKIFYLKQKECLSINEVLSITYNPVESKTSTTEKLLKLVKNKMK